MNLKPRDLVIDQTRKDSDHLETESARRIARAFAYFKEYFAKKDHVTLTQMLTAVSSATCTTHAIKNESEAIQMFIFQNGRGKRPSNLEIIKAQFMYTVHLYGDSQKQYLIDEIKSRFEKIYKSISSIEYKINEDDVLLYTLRVHFNSLWESNSLEKINKCLEEKDPLEFIRSFTQSLANSFDYLSVFFGHDEKRIFAVHSLVTLGNIGISLPFIIKAYTFALDDSQKEQLCTALERIVLRHRLIGTRAELASRLNPNFQSFTKDTPSIQDIVEKIERMAKDEEEGWWAYWNDEQLQNAAQNCSEHSVSKYILWKYEHFLAKNANKGYAPARFDQISEPNIEHISPREKPEGKDSGYGNYDETFLNKYLDCLGNYLLLSGSHNKAISNGPFSEKMKTYQKAPSFQQQEVYQMGIVSKKWTRKEIKTRNKKIIDFIMKTF